MLAKENENCFSLAFIREECFWTFTESRADFHRFLTTGPSRFSYRSANQSPGGRQVLIGYRGRFVSQGHKLMPACAARPNMPQTKSKGPMIEVLAGCF